ncbi:hypothetical protein G6F57_004711 [Rhizopus arrhizus]|uniref:Up-regulated during septation protein 1 domain-containing protein n=1 Tax=Rhizopus oryzae TaxID=64495 RepID=A0A9P6X7K6_RHIOR|nr:hypothetical protein G6F23_003423 [Rhizopus arrhizus]KAG1422015.1 hypothetical protein G6F58_003486 [Rhizopus delemar]KAG0762381.1 hypothetical protein G6F24_006837 [Rhizopus arrhizus]KAG0794954.1 hypothetical protein G6F21_002473 [Rhizopus arrhizus]KAG0799455.1 hypothetical protein G6F22_003208 [Rhizopus arrhizus]
MTSYPLIPSRSPFRIRDSQQTKAQHPINIVTEDQQRWSFALELDDMWHMKPVQQNQQPTQPVVQDDLFTQLLISQAILDSNDFEILSFEQVESLKKEYQDLRDLISTLSQSIQVETRIKNVSKSLGNMHNSRHSVLYLQQQNQSNAIRLNELMQRYEYMNIKAFDVQETLLKHTAAVLNKGIQTSTREGSQRRTEVLNRLRGIVSGCCGEPAESKDPLALLHAIDQRLTQMTSHPSSQDEISQWTRLRDQLLSKLTHTDVLLTALLTQASFYTQKRKAFMSELNQYRNEHAARVARPKPGPAVQPAQIEPTAEQDLLQSCRQLRLQIEQLDSDIKIKSRWVDQHDRKITQLKQELQSPTQDLQTLLDRQAQAWSAHRTTVESNFDTLMMDYDAIITTAMDFDSHRMKYDRKIDQLATSIHQLESQLVEERMKAIVGSNTTQLRKEFRMLIADIKSSHEQRMHREVQERLKLKMQLEQLQHDRQSFTHSFHSVQVQTE